MSAGVVQIPFSAFKLIDLGQSVSLGLYQELYNDHSEPVGLVAVIQALGLIKPSDEAIDRFNQKWTRESVRWKLQETGIEVVTGKSSTSAEMAKTGSGEAALMVLSLLIEMMGTDTVAKIVRIIVESTPGNLVQIKPRRAQIKNVVAAVESQTTCVSWQQEISDVQEIVFEKPVIWMPHGSHAPIPYDSFDLPIECIAAFYQALCTVTRFPENYRCVLQTRHSLTTPYALVHAICGLRTCVVVNGEVVYGNPAPGAWQVRLEKIHNQQATKVKIGRDLEDVQDLLVVEEGGPLRANRVPISGIGKATTIGQGLGLNEADDVASLAIAIAVSTLSKWKREVRDDNRDHDSEAISSELSEDETSSNLSKNPDKETETLKIPIKVRLTGEEIALWWGCSSTVAARLLEVSETAAEKQNPQASWMELKYSKQTIGKIVEFEGLEIGEQMSRRSKTNHASSREDYARLVRMLTAQLLLICFLCVKGASKNNIRVRCGIAPQNSILGKAIKCMDDPEPLGQSDILYSWYYWIKGQNPRDFENGYGPDILTADGHLIYRNLLLDLSLGPDSCEMVGVEPGHLEFVDYRPSLVRGQDYGATVSEAPYYQKLLQSPSKLRSRDKTGRIEIAWQADEMEGMLDLSMETQSKKAPSFIVGSVYQLAKRSWTLVYGDRSLGCNHDEERVGALATGEAIQITTPGNERAFQDTNTLSNWTAVRLYSAHDNNNGQIACLLSTSEDSRGMVRREACLRCCVTAAQKMGLDFIID